MPHLQRLDPGNTCWPGPSTRQLREPRKPSGHVGLVFAVLLLLLYIIVWKKRAICVSYMYMEREIEFEEVCGLFGGVIERQMKVFFFLPGISASSLYRQIRDSG